MFSLRISCAVFIAYGVWLIAAAEGIPCVFLCWCQRPFRFRSAASITRALLPNVCQRSPFTGGSGSVHHHRVSFPTFCCCCCSWIVCLKSLRFTVGLYGNLHHSCNLVIFIIWSKLNMTPMVFGVNEHFVTNCYNCCCSIHVEKMRLFKKESVTWH